MERCNWAIILFFIIGINEVYSLPQRSNLADHEDTRGEHNDLYSKVMPVDEPAGGGRIKRERPMDFLQTTQQRLRHGRLTDVRTQARINDYANIRAQTFLQNFHAIIDRYVQQGETLADAIRHFERDNPHMINSPMDNRRQPN